MKSSLLLDLRGLEWDSASCQMYAPGSDAGIGMDGVFFLTEANRLVIIGSFSRQYFLLFLIFVANPLGRWIFYSIEISTRSLRCKPGPVMVGNACLPKYVREWIYVDIHGIK